MKNRSIFSFGLKTHYVLAATVPFCTYKKAIKEARKQKLSTSTFLRQIIENHLNNIK